MATEVLEHGPVEVGKRLGNSNCADCCTGPGYATPLDAMAGPREALIYVTCVYSGNSYVYLYSPYCFLLLSLSLFSMTFTVLNFFATKISVFFVHASCTKEPNSDF